MIFSKKNHELIRQNEKIVKKPQKHDANLQKNSTLYFQVGLILCLLASYGALEMNFKNSTGPIIDNLAISDEDIFIYQPTPKVIKKIAEVAPKKRDPVIFKDPVVKENDDPIKETKEMFPIQDPPTEDPIKPGDVVVVKPPPEPLSIMAVEQVPIYPGCESETTNLDRKICMDNKINKLIKRKFDVDIASELGLSGMQKIYVTFKIDKLGNVQILNTRAAHNRLAKEAKRVVSKIPIMTPGKQSNQNVEVIYNLPIHFNIMN